MQKRSGCRESTKSASTLHKAIEFRFSAVSNSILSDLTSYSGHIINNCFYYINTNEIPGELSRENMISSHVKITCYEIFTRENITVAMAT